MMKSQVNVLLHVLRGLIKDAQAAYPALKEDLSKDFERVNLYCHDRGLGLFTLDLPHLESLLLKGLEVGRLSLEGPLTQRVSKRIQVPRLYSGLWLRIFDKDACLKHEIDVTALAFLRILLSFGKKLEVDCSYDRIQAVVGAYHDIESKLRHPSLHWGADSLGTRQETVDGKQGDANLPAYCQSRVGDRSHYGSHLGDCPLFPGSSFDEEFSLRVPSHDVVRQTIDPLESVHLVQACSGSLEFDSEHLPLFRSEVDAGAKAKLREDRRLLNQIQKVADLIIGAFDPLDPLFYSEWQDMEGRGIGFKHGPGAVAERLKNWNKSQFPNWPHKLQRTFPYESCGKTAGSPVERPLNHEVASRLIWVPKTAKSPRLIAAEPTAHQWCQQLLLRYLTEQCDIHFDGDYIDFKDQSKSGDLVLAASLDRSLATVDLSDASDRLSCWTVERMFRRNSSLLTALHAARTRYLRDEISEEVSFLSLKKFASQGTATTFPVMSLTMLFIALGSCLNGAVTWANIRKLRSQVRVFGDDIIIPTHGYGRLVRAMELLQLKVNVAKSYADGHFRESCGTDGYRGYNVTAVKPKVLDVDSPTSCQAVVDTSNNLFNKGYWYASTAVLDLLPARLRRGLRYVGHHEVGYSGITSHSGSDESHLKRRWNPRLHRWEVRTWRLYSKSDKRTREGWSPLLDFFASKHNHEHARIVSEYGDTKKVRIDFLWEPSCSRGSVANINHGPEHTRHHSQPIAEWIEIVWPIRTPAIKAGNAS